MASSPTTTVTFTKLRMLQGACFLIFVIIIARLVYLQITIAHSLHERGQKNFLRTHTITPARGNILDAHGALLATNRPINHLYWIGTGSRTLTPADYQVLATLEDILGTPLQTDAALIRALTRAQRRYGRVQLAFELSIEQLSKIEELFPNDPHIRVIAGFRRYYPHATFASHLLGYLGRFELNTATGRMGLEHAFEHILKGQAGAQRTTIDASGNTLAAVHLQQALMGQNICTTIDLSVQTIAEDVFPAGESGTIIVMDAGNGALYALVSRPAFDPNLFLNPIKQEEWELLQENKPFLNRAFNATYPPGSIFKLISISAFLEQGLTTPETTWCCNGYASFRGRRYWCNNRNGHGSLSTGQALAQSCNIPFFESGKKIDIDTLADYAHRFGLGEKTSLPFPEKEGLVPSRAWKKRVKKERWWQGETLSASIGQSFFLVTPIQIARMIGSIFTGYLVTPRLLIQDPVVTTPLGLRQDTIDFLQRSMLWVVTRGTGRRISTLKDIIVHAKTSTAQTSTLEMRDLGKSYLEHGWFAAHVQYKQHPPIVLVVLVEHAGTASVSTTIAKNFLKRYKEYVDTAQTI